MNDLTPKQQAVELIRNAKNILAISHKSPDGDSLGSLVALKIALEKIEKKVTLACPDKPAKVFKFLPHMDIILDKVDVQKDFIITLNLANAQIDNLGYRKNESSNSVDIVITPKEGRFEPSDVKVKDTSPVYDLIITVDTPNLERLGSLASPADLLYEVPVINIDHHPSNENYGKVNWVDLVATSTCEILVSLLEALSRDDQLIDADVATALLTGLIYDTSSFQNVNTTPKSLTVAAQLVAAGARQQEIIRNLYKTKSLETLKLWGLVLSNVKEDKIHRLLWSAVTKEDIAAIGAEASALSGVVDDLLKSATDVDFAMLLSERQDYVHGSLRSIAKGFNVAQISELFGGGGHEVASAFRVEGTLSQKEDEILMKIRNFQNNEQIASRSNPITAEPALPKLVPAEEKLEKITDEPKEDLEDQDDIEGLSPDEIPSDSTREEKIMTKW
jgi:phosphoesterase RecJ-like protein